MNNDHDYIDYEKYSDAKVDAAISNGEINLPINTLIEEK